MLNDGKSARGNGVGLLARGQRTQLPPHVVRLPNARHLQASLFAADALLTVGALVFMLRHSAPDAVTTAVCALAVMLGAWLGWCGLTLGTSES